MRVIHISLSFIWHAQLYLLVLSLLLLYSQNLNALFGYLAGFVLSSLLIFLLLLIFRAGLSIWELVLPVLLTGVAVHFFVTYFYLFGRTDMYWFGLYMSVFAGIETIRFLYHHNSFFESVYRFPLASQIYSSLLALGVWFSIIDFVGWVQEDVLLKIILVTYCGVGIFVQLIQTGVQHKRISPSVAKQSLEYTFLSICLLTATSLLLSYLWFGVQEW